MKDKIKKWWNKPITWGAAVKMSFWSLAISGIELLLFKVYAKMMEKTY